MFNTEKLAQDFKSLQESEKKFNDSKKDFFEKYRQEIVSFQGREFKIVEFTHGMFKMVECGGQEIIYKNPNDLIKS